MYLILGHRYVSYSWSSSDYKTFVFCIASLRFMLLSLFFNYLVDPASSHTLVLKTKPCISKWFVIKPLDCGRLIITVIVLLRLSYRWVPVVIPELRCNIPYGNPPINRWMSGVIHLWIQCIFQVIAPKTPQIWLHRVLSNFQ